MQDVFNDMTPEERSALVGEFLLEGTSYLQILNEKLVEAESAAKKGSGLSDDDLHEMFRAAHNIKGMAAFVGLSNTVRITHDMETLLQKLRSKEVAFDVATIDALFAAFDMLESQFNSMKDAGTELPNRPEVEKLLKDAIDGKAAAAKAQAKTPEPAAKTPAASAPETPAAGTEKKISMAEEENVNLKYLSKFIEDTEQSIDSFNEIMLRVEGGSSTAEDINEVFRLVHTIKGTGGLINAKRISRVAHSMENILSVLREKTASPDSETVTLLFSGIDAIKDMLAFYKANSPADFDIDPICDLLDKRYSELAGKVRIPSRRPAAEQTQAAHSDFSFLSPECRQECSAAVKDGFEIFQINVIIAKQMQMKGVKALLARERLAKRGRVIYMHPEMEAVPETMDSDAEVSFILAATCTEKEIRSSLSIDGIDRISIERGDKKNFVGSETAEQAEAQSEPPAVRTEGKMEEPIQHAEHAAEEKAVAANGNNHAQGGIDLSTIRIDSHKLDNLMNLSGELVIVRARFSQIVNIFSKELAAQKENARLGMQVKSEQEALVKELKSQLLRNGTEVSSDSKLGKLIDQTDNNLRDVSQRISKNSLSGMIHMLDEMTSSLEKISSDIQNGVMQARMIPIEGVFTRFKRIVRDISKNLGREVNLVIEGEETELDKKIVDSLGDPLTHMIRNAVDHGIEDAKTRQAAGKPAAGTVLLRAAHQGNSILIEVRDDGAGIDADKVAKKALSRGIITKEQMDKMSQKEKLNLIFLPGFSMAEKVTDLSGRGVGMDVVKSMIGSVNGTVEIYTELGKGTSFHLRIPLTLAIIKALLVVIGEKVFAFPLESVTEIVKVPAKDIYSVDGNDTIKLRDHALSLVELNKVLKIGASGNAETTHKKVVVVTDGTKRIGVVVDSLVGEDEIVIKSLTEHFASVRGITGASILGDGTIALILDPASIISSSERSGWYN